MTRELAIPSLSLDPLQLPPTDLPGGESRELLSLRQAARNRFLCQGVPHPKLERWKYTNLKPLAAHAYPYPDIAGRGGEAGKLPEIEGAGRMVLVNGVFRPELSDLSGLDGLTVRALSDALKQDDETYLALLKDAEVADDQPLATLNTALMTDGYVIDIAPEAGIDRPLHIVHAVTREMANQVRNIIVAGEGSRASVVETYLGPDDAYWTNVVTQVDVGPRAKLHHYKWQREGQAAFHTANAYVDVAAGAEYDAVLLHDGGRLARQDFAILLTGEEATCRLKGISLGAGEQHHDTTIMLDHRVPRAASDQKFKSVLADKARAVFQGQVKVAHGAEGTDAHQASDSLLLDRTAEADAKPELEIFADDVKCSHGATVGEMDEDKLFYLQSRGLPAADARALLVEGFVRELLEALPEGPVREYLQAGADAAARRLTRRREVHSGPTEAEDAQS